MWLLEFTAISSRASQWLQETLVQRSSKFIEYTLYDQ